MDGDLAATKILLAYTVGKPAGTIDPDRLALEAWKLVVSWPSLSEMLAALSGVRPEIATEVVATSTPSTSTETLEQAANLGHIEGSERVRRRRENTGK